MLPVAVKYFHGSQCLPFTHAHSMWHYIDIMMSAMASQITGVLIVCSAVCSSEYQRKHQSSASLTFVRGIHRWPVDYPHKGPVTRKMFPFDDGIMGVGFMHWLHITMVYNTIPLSVIIYYNQFNSQAFWNNRWLMLWAAPIKVSVWFLVEKVHSMNHYPCTGNAGNVFPATDFRGNHWLAIPSCITARGSCTCREACRDH